MSSCARNLGFDQTIIDATALARITIPADAVAFTLRVTDAAGNGLIWTLRPDGGGGVVFHFAAGEAYSPHDLALDNVLYLQVGAVAGSRVELLVWSS